MALLLCMLFLQVAGVVSSGTPALSAPRSAEGVGTGTAVSTATIRKRVAEVGVNFTVQDNRVLVRNLRREEVTVLEDGRGIPDIVLFSRQPVCRGRAGDQPHRSVAQYPQDDIRHRNCKRRLG